MNKDTLSKVYETGVLGLGIVVNIAARMVFILFCVFVLICATVYGIHESHTKLREKYTFDPSKNGFSWSYLERR